MLNKNEKMLVEAIDTMLQHDAKLGLAIHSSDEATMSAERGYEYLHGQINEMFAVKSAELVHADGVNQAFSKVHNYKYLDDPSFKTAMEKEMVAQAIPAEERKRALGFIPSIIKELKEEQSEWCEKDFGFSPSMPEIVQASRPVQPLNFTIESVPGWPSKANVTSERGNASPGKPLSDK